tara:strand:+ start:218 stop:532 length:315 start_codon:yes stop_codon:yes gene_type:complete
MNYNLKETNEFSKEFKKLPKEIKKRFEEQFKKVEIDPFNIGKSLGYKWFRELKNEGFRVYYLIYKNKIIVLFVGVSDKKSQQRVINIIKNNMKMFQDFIKEKEL